MEKKYIQLIYDTHGAFDCGINEHPQMVMEKLGFVVFDSVPHHIADEWWFTVEPFDFELPSYITIFDRGYSLKFWHYECYHDCKYYQKKVEEGHPYDCCQGGYECVYDEKAKDGIK